MICRSLEEVNTTEDLAQAMGSIKHQPQENTNVVEGHDTMLGEHKPAVVGMCHSSDNSWSLSQYQQAADSWS